MLILKGAKVTDKEKQDTLNMIVSYMDRGFLNNIIEMFKSETDLYPLVADLIEDKRIRVRMGITALMEDLCTLDNEHCKCSLEGLKKHLSSENPTLRGDSAYLISLIGGEEAKELLGPLKNDPNNEVREIVMDFFEA